MASDGDSETTATLKLALPLIKDLALYVYNDNATPAFPENAELVGLLTIFLSQSTFLASGVKKMIRLKDVVAILKDEATPKLLIEMEAGRSRHTKTRARVAEIVAKIRGMDGFEPDSALDKLCGMGNEMSDSFEQYLGNPLWNDTLARKAKDMEQVILAETNRLMDLTSGKASLWKAGLSAESSLEDVLAQYDDHLEALDGRALKKGVKLLCEDCGCFLFPRVRGCAPSFASEILFCRMDGLWVLPFLRVSDFEG